MNDKELDDLLDQNIPEADTNARKIAINLAVSQFSQDINQGNSRSARPIDNHGTPSDSQGTPPSKNSIWSQLMNFLKKPKSGHVFATVAVGFIAFALVNQLPDLETNDRHKEAFNPEALVDSRQPSIAGNSSVKTDDVSSNPELLATIELAERDEPVENEFGSRLSSLSASTSNEIDSLEEIAVTSASAENKVAAAPLRRARLEETIGRQPSKLKDEIIQSTAEPTTEPTQSPSSQRPDLDEQYPSHQENNLKLVQQEPVSTFSADVDTASYSLVRSQLLGGFLPAPHAVRTEEMINYFSYDYPTPSSKAAPFKANISVLNSPWNESKKLIHIGIKGYNIQPEKAPDSNLVFLLDVSGSMGDANKLPLVKQSIALLLSKLKPTDKVSIVVYAGAAGVVLEPTEAKEKSKILSALQRLNAGGSTAGGAGIELAYQLAEQNFNANAVNRIILATDGDFNVGQASNDALKALVERKRDNGVFLSILGFGRNNYQDDMMQTLAQNGNGVAAYIDSISEAKKVLVDQASSTLFTIAQDVKLQVEFNPTTVSDYRLVGYETRHLNREDFNNDKVDAGDIGAGHTVTAIYEITPSNVSNTSIEPLRYAAKANTPSDANNKPSKATEYGFLKIRYKLPTQSVSKLIEQPILIAQAERNATEQSDLNFSVAAASFAQYLKGGKYTGKMTLSDITNMAKASKGDDPYGYRSEFIRLLELAEIAKP
jgi:Ca-activated chloride channel family protein